MAEYIDISLPVSQELPIWPNSLPIQFDKVFDMDRGDEHTDTDLHMSAHAGTHIDAPLHFIKDGKPLSSIPLDVLIGPALVVELLDVDLITESDLEQLDIPPDTVRILFKTRNSALWGRNEKQFQEDFVAIGKDAAQWLVNRGIKLVAVDYLSVQPYHDTAATHQILLGAEVVAVEGVNLHGVEPGHYELICLPIRLIGTEGGPVRALLKKTAP